MTRLLPLTIEARIATAFNAADLRLNPVTTSLAIAMHKAPLGSSRMAMLDRIASHLTAEAREAIRLNLVKLAHGVAL